MSAWRYTVTTVSPYGQRPYGPWIRTYQVLFEVDYGGSGGWKPSETLTEEFVREKLNKLGHGFTEFTYPPTDREATTSDYFATRLQYLKKVGPGLWEFQTYEANTD
jgi:hypothetical protein